MLSVISSNSSLNLTAIVHVRSTWTTLTSSGPQFFRVSFLPSVELVDFGFRVVLTTPPRTSWRKKLKKEEFAMHVWPCNCLAKMWLLSVMVTQSFFADVTLKDFLISSSESWLNMAAKTSMFSLPEDNKKVKRFYTQRLQLFSKTDWWHGKDSLTSPWRVRMESRSHVTSRKVLMTLRLFHCTGTRIVPWLDHNWISLSNLWLAHLLLKS